MPHVPVRGEYRPGSGCLVFCLPVLLNFFLHDFTVERQLCMDEEKKRVKIVDSTRSTGKVSVREMAVEELLASGYEIYRKRENV